NGLVSDDPEYYFDNLIITEDYASLRTSQLVIECTIEDKDIKASVYQKIEAVISAEALLTSNTSAIPISSLQKLTRHPERFLGLHWAEPSHTTRFLEIICGDQSSVPVFWKLSVVTKAQWKKANIYMLCRICGEKNLSW